MKGLEKVTPYLYTVGRIMIGLFFAYHGAQKFGFIGDGSVSGFAAGVGVPFILALGACLIELVGGIAIAFGIFSRLFASMSIVVLLVAYFMVHPPSGMSLFAGGGEMALVYIAGFLMVMGMGNGALSIERAMLKKEVF